MSDQEYRDEALTRALRVVAEDDETLGASAGVEARLLTAARAIARARRRRVYAAAKAVAAVLVAVIAVATWRAATVRGPAVDPAVLPEVSTQPQPGEIATEFFPLMYSNVPITGGHAVRLELPQAALTSFGLVADDASDKVLADVLVGQDGLARAVRFVLK
jgi:hypothetical protein